MRTDLLLPVLGALKRISFMLRLSFYTNVIPSKDGIQVRYNKTCAGVSIRLCFWYHFFFFTVVLVERRLDSGLCRNDVFVGIRKMLTGIAYDNQIAR